MKQTVRIVVFCMFMLWLLSVTSCTKSHPEPGIPPYEGDVVEWEMVRENPASKALINGNGVGSFEEGDTIVVYARNMADGRVKHVTLKLQNGRWTPKVRWEELGEEVLFTAWYTKNAVGLHQAAQTTSEYRHTLAVSQQGEGYGNADLLCAQTRGKKGEKVQLTFEHVLHRLTLILESRNGSYTTEQLQQAEVQVMTPCQIPFLLADGTLQTPSDSRWISPCRQDNATWTALVCPQRVETMGSADGWIRIRLGEQETTVKVPETVNGQPFAALEAGKELTYRLNVQKGDTQDSYAGTTHWVYGVREPDDAQWNADHTQLAWTEGCGWYDCNKVNPSDITSGGDGLMCWAAAASNLIHWWLCQNSETEAVQAYTGPNAVPADMLHSEIFQLFKNHFPNAGEYPIKAINWFFNGVFQRKIYDTDPVDPAAGFFRTQLGVRSLGAEYSGTDMARERFNALIKQALAARQGIMFVVNLGRAWSTHAVTLWGATFDADGWIETLYMVDNNDGRYDARGTIRTMKVKYLPYSDSNPELYPYVPNSVGDFTIRIESLCTLSLGQEWVQ